jgi:predicted nuclease with TOPRIM domain
LVSKASIPVEMKLNEDINKRLKELQANKLPINTDLKQQLNEFKTSFEQSQASNQELTDQLNNLKSESDTLQRLNAELNESLAGLKNDHTQLKDKNSLLSTNLNESNTQLKISIS